MRISANGVSIEIDDRGPAGAEPLVLVMGLGMQLIAWPDELVGQLIARGFRVIRLDNRDAGLSQGFDELGVPHVGWAAMRYLLRLPVKAPYALADMARDTFGVLDALGITRAHVCGASMGGMIAQHMAALQPQRVKSLTLMMTTSGARHLPQASGPVRRAMLKRPADPNDRDALVRRLEDLLTLIGSPAFRPDPQTLRRQLHAGVARAYRPAGLARQIVAIAADGDRSPLLARITAPTHIVHGRADPLVPVAAAHDLHGKIAGSTIDVIDGMGHDVPGPLLQRFAEGIAGNAGRVGRL